MGRVTFPGTAVPWGRSQPGPRTPGLAEQTCTGVGNVELHPQKVSKGDFIKPKDFLQWGNSL